MERDALDSWPARLAPLLEPGSRLWLVTDERVWSILRERVVGAPGSERVAGVYEMAPGEPSKSIAGWLDLLGWFADAGVHRRDLVIALGGSMVSDVTGFAAATFMRGIAYANVPTTLLAQVDGSVGGKVAVNTASAKNYIGAFHHPVAVLVDPTVLSSLPHDEISNGLAEVIKSFVISDDEFSSLEQRIDRCLDGDLDALTWAVQRAITQKMNLVDADPYEADLCRALNFGHTLGHAIEAHYGYQNMRHGFAVAVGMAAATQFGLNRGITDPDAAERIFDLIARARLPMTVPAGDAERIVARTRPIAAVRHGRLRFVAPRRIGEMAYCDDVEPWELVKAVRR